MATENVIMAMVKAGGDRQVWNRIRFSVDLHYLHMWRMQRERGVTFLGQVEGQAVDLRQKNGKERCSP